MIIVIVRVFPLLHEQTESEEIDELGSTQQTEAHAETYDTSEESNQILPAERFFPGKLGDSKVFEINVEVGHLGDLVPHSSLHAALVLRPRVFDL